MSTKNSKYIRRCKFFRAKSPSYGLIDGGESFEVLNLDNLATCWCVKTQGPNAPDSGFVDPNHCIQGRKCFVMPSE